MTSSREYPERPLAGVGVIVRRGDCVLLVSRGTPPRQGEWSLPGGVQHLGETVLAAAAREVAEETGLVVRPTAIVDVIDVIEWDEAAAVRFHYVLIAVACDWQGGEPRPSSDASAVAWVTVADLGRYGVRAETAAVIRKAFRLPSGPR